MAGQLLMDKWLLAQSNHKGTDKMKTQGTELKKRWQGRIPELQHALSCLSLFFLCFCHYRTHVEPIRSVSG